MDRDRSNFVQPKIVNVLLGFFGAAVIGFALAAHRPAWEAWRWACLIICGGSLCASWSVMARPWATIWGKSRAKRRYWWITVAGVLGILEAAQYRYLFLGMAPFPTTFHVFALAAMAVGFTEEVIWRGWMQGVLMSAVRPWVAVGIAAASHAAYKTALFVFPPADMPTYTLSALSITAGITFAAGLFLGWLRTREGTIAAPVAFHVLFDLFVYGQCQASPWWVW